jgi:hypothetical protein
LQGFDCLWHVAILSTDEKVRKQSRDFLIDLFLKFKVTEKERKLLTDIFLQKLESVFAKLSSTPQVANQSWHQHWLRVVVTFI